MNADDFRLCSLLASSEVCSRGAELPREYSPFKEFLFAELLPRTGIRTARQLAEEIALVSGPTGRRANSNKILLSEISQFKKPICAKLANAVRKILGARCEDGGTREVDAWKEYGRVHSIVFKESHRLQTQARLLREFFRCCLSPSVREYQVLMAADYCQRNWWIVYVVMISHMLKLGIFSDSYLDTGEIRTAGELRRLSQEIRADAQKAPDSVSEKMPLGKYIFSSEEWAQRMWAHLYSEYSRHRAGGGDDKARLRYFAKRSDHIRVYTRGTRDFPLCGVTIAINPGQTDRKIFSIVNNWVIQNSDDEADSIMRAVRIDGEDEPYLWTRAKREIYGRR